MDVFSAIDSMEPKAGIRFNHRRAIKPVRSLHNPLKSTEKCSRATDVLSGRVSVPPPPTPWSRAHGMEESRIPCRPGRCPEWTNT